MNTPSILLVDDDADDREIIIDALKTLNADVKVTTADNGEAALRILSSLLMPEKTPCLIVMDLNMPRMNGVQTLQNMKRDERLRNIPTIIYSTSVNELEREKCIILGAHSYITKPLSYRECLETARLFLLLCQTKSIHEI